MVELGFAWNQLASIAVAVESDAAGVYGCVYVCVGVAVFMLPVPGADGVHIKQVCVCVALERQLPMTGRCLEKL